MSSTIIHHIKQLVNTRNKTSLLRGVALAELPVIDNAYLILEDDAIVAYGAMNELTYGVDTFHEAIDATGKLVLPAWCDSHTHLVFAASREEEFIDKIKGKTYAEIAANGGGIINSAAKLAETSEDELYRLAWARLQQVQRMGTGAIEIKSGYGLTVESELKMLRVIRRLQKESSLIIRSTFLGAHAIPPAYRGNRQGYIDLLIQEMLPAIGQEKLADFIDVFCEEGFFSPAEMTSICKAGKAAGLKPKLHVNQLHSIGGIEAAIDVDAVSVDHLETMTAEDIERLSRSGTIGTLLPTAAFFLRMNYQPARALIDAGCAIALASDFNPGSSPSGNMNFVNALACIQLRMLPEEVINSSTLNGAYAMEVEQLAGSITVGKKANLVMTKPVPSITYLPYAFGDDLIDQVWTGGRRI